MIDPVASLRVSGRVAGIEESATLAVDAKAKALKAAGRPVIGFGAGEPDFPTPGFIVDAAVQAAHDPRWHQYSPAGGLPALREAIAAKTERDSGFVVNADQVLVTNGGKHAIFNAIASLINPGDEVIIQAPYWVTYPEVVRIFGGVPVPVVTDESTGYLATVEQLEAARTERTKMIIFVSPSNPTGAVYPPDQVTSIGRWAVANEIWVMTDEIYEHLTYGDARFSSLPTLVPEAADRCVVVNGVAKTYAMTGWRVGWLIGPKDIIKGAANLQSHSTSNVNNIAQVAALAAVSGPLDAVHEMRTAFDRRRLSMVKLLNQIPGITCPEPQGAFYAYPSVQELIGKTLRGTVLDSSITVANVVLDESEVAVVPGEAFGTPGYLRMSYALSDDDLVEGVDRMAQLLSEAK